MTDLTITLEEDGNKGRYVARLPGSAEEAEMTYSRISPSRIIVDHTGVPDAFKGMGVGKALALNIISEARSKGFTIVPLCPFLKAQADRNPDWGDVIEGMAAPAAG
ncbi:MAG: N-acetyltransferase [Maricaulis sp.]|uniref:GNAT family N-acetyltransferase n=2 Tax=Maricaulis sp. TaxID=1486257 RepID=UPI001B239D51|nr:GNAT family N-acetyltransferase [Maricaulis sp.]MBO6728487.1 N-acetyltransferase [Maricaulis sp.]MBO6848460.1 N-acetyltransferase [Maricaulis sp.]MBO6877269.1 N-acetyltransferase [Maricaulis sp.]